MNQLIRCGIGAALLLSVAIASAQTPEATLDEVKRAGASKSAYRKPARPGDKKTEDTAAPQANLAEFRASIAPILQTSCAGCHGPDESEADFRVDTLDPDLLHGQDASWWLEVMQVLSNHEMPPADSEAKLAGQNRAKVIDWLSSELLVASQVAHSEGGHSSFRRLTRYEYNYALQDLLGLPYDFAKDLPPETPSEDGFLNSSDMLHLSVSQLATYRELARSALLKATVQGEAPKPIYYAITMDEAVKLMAHGELKQIEKLKSRDRDPEKIAEQVQKIRDKMYSFNPSSPHFVNLDSGVGVQGRYRYSGARYSWTPTQTRPDVPPPSRDVMVLPGKRSQIIDLGDHLPDSGTMRIRLRAWQSSESVTTPAELRILFGFQASNNSQTSFRVGDDLVIDASATEPRFVTFDIPLGEISRNSYRGNQQLGQTPNPSEYLVLLNRSDQPIQIDYIEVTAPFVQQWPPASHQRIFFASDHQDDELEYAREILRRWMRRAWRREIDSAEIDQKLELFSRLRPTFDSFQAAMVEVLATVIASPKFLYVVQSQSEDRSLSDIELATRLSMFLWSSLPDDELLSLASEGALSDPAILREQTARMLDDPRRGRFEQHFVRQWLGLQLLEYLDVDKKAYPGFDDDLKEAMQGEPIAFFAHLLSENRSVIDFLHADYTLANDRLARHYGIADVHGSHFRRVSLPADSNRGGLLTQAGLLAMNSDGKDSHPLKRGIWLLENLLHDPPPPPPPAVPEIDLTDPDILKLTLKERMEDHRNDPACRSCHARIDPWGIALENFDAVGAWRDRIAETDVDATSVLFNGQQLRGADGLKRFLLEHRQDQFVRALTHKLTTYALGRPLSFADRADVEQITERLRRDGDGLATLIHLIVASDLFRSR